MSPRSELPVTAATEEHQVSVKITDQTCQTSKLTYLISAVIRARDYVAGILLEFWQTCARSISVASLTYDLRETKANLKTLKTFLSFIHHNQMAIHSRKAEPYDKRPYGTKQLDEGYLLDFFTLM